MKKLIAIAVIAVSSLFTVVSANSADGTLSGTVFDTTLPMQKLMTFNNLGCQNGQMVAITIEVFGDSTHTYNGAQTYRLQIKDDIEASSHTLSSIMSVLQTTTHKITKIVVKRRSAVSLSKEDIQKTGATF